MKKTHIGIILICYLNLSFNTGNELINFSNEKSIIQNESDPIIGKYYIEIFKQNLKNGLILLKNKPKLTDNVFEFDFKENGNIKVTDLTEFHHCANGVLYMDSAKWKKIENKIYKVVFNGGYFGDSTFEIDVIYILEDTSDSKVLKMNKILKNVTKDDSAHVIDIRKNSKDKK